MHLAGGRSCVGMRSTRRSPLADEQIAQIPLFLRLVRLIQFARITRALDITKDSGQPDWLSGLIDKLEDRMDAYRMAITGE